MCGDGDCTREREKGKREKRRIHRHADWSNESKWRWEEGRSAVRQPSSHWSDAMPTPSALPSSLGEQTVAHALPKPVRRTSPASREPSTERFNAAPAKPSHATPRGTTLVREASASADALPRRKLEVMSGDCIDTLSEDPPLIGA